MGDETLFDDRPSLDSVHVSVAGRIISPKGPRTQRIGFWGPNTINIIVFGP